ncbi:hypothetical protein [Egicoccus halophilus]|uniref:Uncharacterized protein n=1 Tax=Egicoccus halophilus TaxID=1670830 RepID=A0A8J3ETL7_9ACTN|nr:hypothetical protein [Egicoccus halophilus]GGI04178.1 hypothetical protein GCM10011354_07770 [Egicoccus halophilus]
MNASRPHPTPDEARERLDVSSRGTLRNRRDRRIHATGTAVIGVVIASTLATQNVVGPRGDIVRNVALLVLVLGAIVWMERAATTVPRRVRLLSRVGVGLSFVLGLTVALPWLNLRAQTEPNTWAMALGAAAVIAVPALVSAVAIATGRR